MECHVMLVWTGCKRQKVLHHPTWILKYWSQRVNSSDVRTNPFCSIWRTTVFLTASSAVCIYSSKGSCAFVRGREQTPRLLTSGCSGAVVYGGSSGCVLHCSENYSVLVCHQLQIAVMRKTKDKLGTSDVPFAYFWSLLNLQVSMAEKRATPVQENPRSRKKKENREKIIASFLHFRRGKDVQETNREEMEGWTLPLGTEFSVQGGRIG